jgi:site-specific DNA recombinase
VTGCGAPLIGCHDNTRGDAAYYRCPSRRHLHRLAGEWSLDDRSAEGVEAFVTEVVIARLERPDAAEIFADYRRGEAAELREEESRLRGRLDDLTAAFADGVIDRGQLVAGTRRLRERLGEVAARLASMTSSPVLAELLGAVDMPSMWAGLSTSERRQVIGVLMDVVVHPPGRGARRFDPETLEIRWKAGDGQ